MTFKRSLQVIIPGMMLMLLSATSNAQVFPRGNGMSLSDLTQVDLHVQVASWQDLPDEPFAFRMQAQEALASRLESSGIRRRAAHRDYLVCKLQAVKTQDLVAYTTTVEYWGLRSTDVHTMLWESGAIAAVAPADFSAGRIANECADTFLNEWSKWNPEP